MTAPHPARRALPRTLALTTILAAVAAPALAEGPSVRVVAKDFATKSTLATFSASAEIQVPDGTGVKLRVDPASGDRVDRVLFKAQGTDPDCVTGDGKAASVDAAAPFVVGLPEARDCRWTVTAFDDAAKTSRTLTARLLWPDGQGGADGQGGQGGPESPGGEAPSTTPRRYDLTKGTPDASHLVLGPKGKRSAHGVRVFCVVSHLSYDDPIVHRHAPDAAHLHMFLGNTSTDAHSTRSSLKGANRSSCEGGRSMESAYWMPALFDEKDRVVLPERFVTYYKTFLPGGTPDRIAKGVINPIPDGLEMLAGPTALNYDANPSGFTKVRNDGGRVQLTVVFPQCVAVDAKGRPRLSHRQMPGAKSEQVNSHVSYAVWAAGSKTGCPASHPYRLPGVFYNAWYDVDPNSRWYLSSDTNRKTPGHSLHADYVAAWDPADMAKLVQCNEEARSCSFEGKARQLPERFYDWDGERIYLNSVAFMPGRSRTPWNRSLTKTRQGHGDALH